MVELDGLTYHYRSGAGITDVSLKAEGVTGVAGRNGAGKTTLFSCLTGFLAAQAGRITVGGRHWNPREEAWGYAPAEDVFLPRLTGRQNLEYQSWLRTGNRAAWAAWNPWLDELDLGSVLDKPFREYSTGMRKKVQVVSSLIGDPPLVVWDEPHNGVDLVSNAVISRLMAHVAGRGQTLLVSSHVAEVLVAVSTSLVILKEGRVAHTLTPPYPADLVPLL